MRPEEIEAGRTYQGRRGGASDRCHVYALFQHDGRSYAVKGHPAFAVWIADVTELENFAEWAQAVVEEEKK